jgi:hypothetical protein
MAPLHCLTGMLPNWNEPMRRNGTGTILGAVAGAALTFLAACGTAASPAFHPAGEAPAVAGRSEPGQPGLLRFPFPSDIHFEFDSPLPSSPPQAAAVIADENFQLAYYYGIYSQGTDLRYRAYIADQKVLASVEETLAGQAAVHEGFTGTIRFYNTTVQPAAWAGELVVASCVDSSRLFDTDIRTGRLRPARPGAAGRSHFLESDILAKRGGHWRIVGTGVTYYPRGQAKECTP